MCAVGYCHAKCAHPSYFGHVGLLVPVAGFRQGLQNRYKKCLHLCAQEMRVLHFCSCGGGHLTCRGTPLRQLVRSHIADQVLRGRLVHCIVFPFASDFLPSLTEMGNACLPASPKCATRYLRSQFAAAGLSGLFLINCAGDFGVSDHCNRSTVTVVQGCRQHCIQLTSGYRLDRTWQWREHAASKGQFIQGGYPHTASAQLRQFGVESPRTISPVLFFVPGKVPYSGNMGGTRASRTTGRTLTAVPGPLTRVRTQPNFLSTRTPLCSDNSAKRRPHTGMG